MEKLKVAVSRIADFVGKNKKPIGIVVLVIGAMALLVLLRDGFKPEESTGEITITTSSGEVISTVTEQPELPKGENHDNP